jgi:hypothetical protein
VCARRTGTAARFHCCRQVQQRIFRQIAPLLEGSLRLRHRYFAQQLAFCVGNSRLLGQEQLVCAQRDGCLGGNVLQGKIENLPVGE